MIRETPCGIAYIANACGSLTADGSKKKCTETCKNYPNPPLCGLQQAITVVWAGEDLDFLSFKENK